MRASKALSRLRGCNVSPEPTLLAYYDKYTYKILMTGSFIAGDNAGADECCRLHDLCKPIIKAFQTRYHFSNPSVVPISHCGCDMQFYNCLRRVNSQASNTIGKIFFNIAKMKCFDFDMRNICTSSFLGFCTEYSYKCVAILKNNKNYPS